MLQCVAVTMGWQWPACCSVLCTVLQGDVVAMGWQRVAGCVLQCVAVFCRVLQWLWGGKEQQAVLQCVAVCYSVLQCVAVCCNVLQRVEVCCSVLQCVAVCCSVLHCVAVAMGWHMTIGYPSNFSNVLWERALPKHCSFALFSKGFFAMQGVLQKITDNLAV